MAVRIQVRRGTTSEWNSADPILNSGEIGYNTTLAAFKIGNGTSAWSDLDYYQNSANLTPSDINAIDMVEKGAPNGVATLDENSKLTLSQLPDVAQVTVHAVANQAARLALSVEVGDIAIQADNGQTYVLASSPASTNGNWTAISVADPFPTHNTDNLSEGSTNKYYTDERAQDAVGLNLGTGLSYNDGTGAISVTSNTYEAYGSTSTHASLTETHGATGAIVGTTNTQTLSNKTISLASNTVSGTTAEFNTALSDANFVTTGDTGTVTSTMIADGTIVNADINASAAIALSKLATDPLARANHTGTQTASTISDFDTQVRTSKVTDLAAPTGSFSMNSNKITNLADPTADQDAATKAYVDAMTVGLNVHDAVRVATTANVNLTNALENGDTLDGVTLATGDRVLVKNQNTTADNGVYIVQNNGAAVRATDYNQVGEVDSGDFIFVQSGTVNAKTGWVQINTITTLGSDPIEFTQFSGAGTYTAGNGLTLTGTTFSINTGTTVDLNTSQTLTNKTINLSNNTVSGTIAQFNTALSDGDFATIAGTETLTNKTLTSPTITGTGSIAGTFTGNLTGNVTGDVSGNAGTVTNGVYTTGSYANPTWITSLAASKVGLGNVENTALSTWAGSTNITTLGTISTGTWSGTTIALNKGGTGATTAAGARTNLGSTTVGDNVFTLTNPSSLSYIKINADNTVAAASASTVKTDLSLNNVENTALSTWAGSTSITTLGTVATGTWNATAIGVTKGGTGLTSISANQAVYGSGSNTITAGTLPIAAGGTGATTAMTAATALLPSQTGNSGKYLTNDGSGTLSWATVSGYSAPTLGSTSIASGATVTTIAGLTLSNATLTGTLTAASSTGTSGQVLSSTGTGVQWSTPAAGAAFSEFLLIGA